jgi:hypothetical protein
MEDAIHGLNVNVTGGSIHITTEEDGIHAENTVNVTDATVNIHKSYKGIKGLKANVSKAVMGIVSFSDAIDSPEVLIEDSEAYLLDKIDTGDGGTLTVNKSTVVIVSNSSTPTLPTNKDISYVKCVVLKPQMAVSDRFINISGGGIDVTLKLSKSFKDKMSVTYISDKMEKGQYYAAIGKYEDEFMFFDTTNGNIFCESCGKFGMKVPVSVISAVRYIVLSDRQKIFNFNLNETNLNTLSDLTEKYTLSVLQRRFKTLDFYHML